MKAFTKTLAIVGLSLGVMGVANANSVFVAADDNITSQICVVATQGSKLKLNKAIKNAGLTKQYVVKNVTCNEQPIVEFVAENGTNANSINAYITGVEYQAEYIANVAPQ